MKIYFYYNKDLYWKNNKNVSVKVENQRAFFAVVAFQQKAHILS